MPDYLEIPKSQILRYWDDWIVWRMVGRRIEAFVLAMGWKGPLPKALLETVFFLDSFFGKMELKEAKRKAAAEANKHTKPRR